MTETSTCTNHWAIADLLKNKRKQAHTTKRHRKLRKESSMQHDPLFVIDKGGKVWG